MALATFALGCFWGPDEFFSRLPGVLKVVTGYTGGEAENPTYTNLGDHTESVQIEFDPSIIPYEKLLEYFWEQHDPTTSHKIQYRSIIFTHDGQREAALKSKEETQKKYSKPILTEIIPTSRFYKAEEYHQKYFRKQKGAVC